MSDTTFSSGTVIRHEWLNDVDSTIYQGIGSGGIPFASVSKFQNAGTGGIVRSVQDRLREVISVKDFGAIGDGTTDDTISIQNAVIAANALSTKGAVYLPPGNYKISTTITVYRGVSMYGAGGIASVLQCYNCDGITAQMTTWDQGMQFFENFGINSMAGNNFTGFRVASSPYAGEQDGFYLTHIRMFDWDTAIYFGSCWQSCISECYIENVNTGIRFDNHAVLNVIDSCQIIHGAGGRGAASNLGVQFGFTDIEANVLQNCFVFGFLVCVKLDDPWHCTIKDNIMLSAAAPGTGGMRCITFTTVKEHLNITGNMLEGQVQAGSSFISILGAATFTPSNGQTIIANNRIFDDFSGGTSIGVQLNDVANTNQNNIIIENNNFTGFTAQDILVYNGINIVIEHNDCRSSVPTNSIAVSGAQSQIYVNENRCTKAISLEPAYLINGQIKARDNMVSGTYNGLRNSATYDPPSLGDGVGTTTTVTVTGAALGDFAVASFSLDTQGITITAWVSAANTVSVRFQNESGGALDLASGTLRVRVIPVSY